MLSFLVVGSYWVLHRRILVHVDRHDNGLLWLNLVFVPLVAFVGYATSVFSTYPGQFFIVVPWGVLTLTGFSLFALGVYPSRKQLVEEGFTSRVVAIQVARFLASPVVFVVSIVVAAFDPAWAIVTWLILIPINGALQSQLVESVKASLQGSKSVDR